MTKPGQNPGGDTFVRFLATKHGSGVGARADANGNHVLSAQLIDAYSQRGEKVPADVSAALQELNTLVSREALMDKSSGSARAALAGTGYDALAVRKRVQELESTVYARSADARNYGAQLEMREKEAKLQQLEEETARLMATSDARTQSEIAALELSTSTAGLQVSAMERAKAAQAVTDHIDTKGISLEDAEEAFSSADPDIMGQVFGTTDRKQALAGLQQLRLRADEETAGEIARIGQAAVLQSLELANTTSADDLNDMLANPALRPKGASLQAIQQALQIHGESAEARSALINAKQQGITDEIQLKQLGLTAARPDEMLTALTKSLSDAGAVLSPKELAMAATTEGLNAMSSALLEATQGGKLPVRLTIEGEEIEFSAMEVLDAYAQKIGNAELNAATQIAASQQMRVAIREHQETSRQLRTMENMLGVPLSASARSTYDRMIADASNVLTQASRPGVSAELRRQLMDGYQLQMENARELITEHARAGGVPADVLEDVKQGRFMSAGTYKRAIVDAFTGRAAASPVQQAVFNELKRAGVTRNDVENWVSSDSEDIEDIGKTWTGRKVERARIAAAVDRAGQQLLANAAFAEISTNPAFQMLPVNARKALDDAVRSSWADLPPDATKEQIEAANDPFVVLKRITKALQVADTLLVEEDLARVARGEQPAPTYQPGQIMRQMAEGVAQGIPRNGNRVSFADALTGGTMDRGTAAMLVEYVGARRPGIKQYGSGALAYDNIGNTAANVVIGDMQAAMGMQSLVPVGPVLHTLARDTERAFGGGSVTAPGVGSVTTPTGLTTEESSYVRQAALSLYMQKSLNPQPSALNIMGIEFDGGLGISSPQWGYGTVSPSELSAELTAMGRPELAAKIKGQ